MHGHYDVIDGCVPTLSDIRVDAILWKNGSTYSVTRNPQSRIESHSDMGAGWALPWSNVRAEPF